jgi:protein TonB
MKKAIRYLILTFLIVLGVSPVSGEEAVAIHVHLYRGSWTADHPVPKETMIWPPQFRPEIAALKSKLEAPQDELTVSIIDALIAAHDLKTVDEYFTYVEKWAGRSGVFSRDIEHEDYRFKLVYIPRRLSTESLELKLSLYITPDDPTASGKGGRMDRLLETKLILEYNAPVLVTMPYGVGAFFMLIYVDMMDASLGSEKDAGKRSRDKASHPITPPKEVATLIPAYPEELREQGVHGQVGLQVTIDEKGKVVEVRVAKALHPYLDFAAVQAVRQWTYEPATQEGKPVLVTAKITMVFDPETYRRFEEKAENNADGSPGQEQSSRTVLAQTLGAVAAYCERLEGAALEFICEERISETHYNFSREPKWGAISVASRETGQVVDLSLFPLWDPQRTIRSNYVCDYLFVRKGDRVEERRVVLKDNGRKMPDRNRLLEEKRFTALNPVLAAIELFGRGHQALFNYRIIGSENMQGRKASVIEAIPRSGNTRGVEYARVWVDSENYQILKSEVQGVPIEGYDDVLRDSLQFRVRPYLLTTHTYEFEKNGVRFPGRSMIRVEYPKRGDFYKNRTLKLKIDMSYERYQFFVVETDRIVRKLSN